MRHNPLHQSIRANVAFSGLLRVADLSHYLDVTLEEDWWVQPLRVVWFALCCRWCHGSYDAIVLIVASARLAVSRLQDGIVPFIFVYGYWRRGLDGALPKNIEVILHYLPEVPVVGALSLLPIWIQLDEVHRKYLSTLRPQEPEHLKVGLLGSYG